MCRLFSQVRNPCLFSISSNRRFSITSKLEPCRPYQKNRVLQGLKLKYCAIKVLKTNLVLKTKFVENDFFQLIRFFATFLVVDFRSYYKLSPMKPQSCVKSFFYLSSMKTNYSLLSLLCSCYVSLSLSTLALQSLSFYITPTQNLL